MILQIFSIISVIFYLLYKWAIKNHTFFFERGVPYEQPWPFFGNLSELMLGKESFTRTTLNFYQRNKQHKISGFFHLRDPLFFVTDPEIIKSITVKEFDSFPNHYPFIKMKNEPLFSNMLCLMNDKRWKNMRHTLIYAFTPSKMRAMFALMNKSFDESLNHLRSQSKNGQGFDLEMKECFARLSNDIITATVLGLKVNSYEDQNNDFYTIGHTLTNFTNKQMFKLLIVSLMPNLMDFIGFRVFDQEKTEYFIKLIIEIMKYRKKHNIVQPGMIQVIIDTKKESPQQWTDEEIAAQCFLFFFSAFENNASFICTTCHEIMHYPDIQQRMYEEAKEIESELQGAPLNYDVLGKMKYMDMVVSESLRKWPLGTTTDRICSKDCRITDDDGKVIFDFKKGDRIMIPIIGIQRDERYFENPETFDPERFSDKNKRNIKPFTYLPFGMGPRNCIGSRYALMQAKAMLYHLILNFKMEPSAKTAESLIDDVEGIQITPQSGFWMRFILRNN